MKFENINVGFNQTFVPGLLSIGIVIPIENYSNSTVPRMKDHMVRVKLVEELGFSAVWVRDVALHVPEFGDAGQTFDPFTYLGFLAGVTNKITLGVASIALPLRHPLHIAKAAATLDNLTEGRFVMGVASGDRPEEYPSMSIDFNERSKLFRDSFEYIRQASLEFPVFENIYGHLNGRADVLPKPFGKKLPLMVTGHSRQDISWISKHSDGWMYYPRNLYMQEYNIREFRESIPKDQGVDKPFLQPLYVDLHSNEDYKAQPIHLGFRIGINYLIEYLDHLKTVGVNHLAINLRFNQNRIEDTLELLAHKLLPLYHKD